jgi:hypothetical protein
VKQGQCLVKESDLLGAAQELDAILTVVELTSVLSTQIAVVSMQDSLGGTYLLFSRREKRYGGWHPWCELHEKEQTNRVRYSLVWEEED